MAWRRCAQGILAVLIALGLALGGLTALGGRAAPQVIATIPVGASPYAVAVNPTTNRAYVANAGADSISVIDGASNTVVATIPIAGASGQLLGVAVNATTNRVYTAYPASPDIKVAVIDGGTDTVTATVVIPSACCAPPYAGVAVDSATNRVYVLAAGATPGVAVVDGAANAYLTTIPLGGGAFSVAVNPVTNRIYAPYQTNTGFALAVLDGGTNTLGASIPFTNASGSPFLAVAVNPSTNRIYMTTWTSPGSTPTGSLIVVDGDTNAVAATVSLAAVPFAVATDAATNAVYVVGVGMSTLPVPGSVLLVLDGDTNAVTTTLSLPGVPPAVGVAANPSTDTAYVSLNNLNSVAVVSGPLVGLSASALAFGNQQVGTAGTAQTVTLTNTGGMAVSVASATIAGANSADFLKTSDTCTGATLLPAATCAVGVAFAPTAAGSRAATLVFADSADNSPQRVTLSGTGTPVPPPAPAPPGWSSWQPLGGILTDAPAAAGLNGSLYIFAEGTDHALYVRSSADGVAFTPWRSLGGILTAAPAAASANGKLYVFAKGSDNALYVMSSADGTSWSGWTRLGGILTAPPAAAGVGNTLYVLAKGSDNALYVMHSTDGATWSGWQDLGGILTDAPAAAGLNGTLYVFAKGSDDALYQRSSADGVEFTPWQDLGGILTAAPAAASYTPAGGVPTLYTFATGTDKTLYARTSTDGVAWTDWLSLGGQLVGPPAAAGVGNTLYAVVRWSDNSLYVRFVR